MLLWSNNESAFMKKQLIILLGLGGLFFGCASHDDYPGGYRGEAGVYPGYPGSAASVVDPMPMGGGTAVGASGAAGSSSSSTSGTVIGGTGSITPGTSGSINTGA